MKVFLIILAVLVVIIAVILSLSAEFTVIFDNGWTTRIKVLWIEKDIELSKLINFLLFPEKAAEEAAEKAADEIIGGADEVTSVVVADGKDGPTAVFVAEPDESKEKVEIPPPDDEIHLTEEEIEEITRQLAAAEKPKEEPKPTPPQDAKPNFIMKIWQEEGIVGMMEFITNLLETAGTAVSTLMKGLHIYSLYVKMIIGGGDAADIAEKFGSLAGHYQPIKGIILNRMKVDHYDDYLTADFIAPRSEYEFQLIAGLNVGLLVRMGLRAGRVFLVNLIRNKKSK